MNRKQFLKGIGSAMDLSAYRLEPLLTRNLDVPLIVKVDDLEGDVLSRDYMANEANSCIGRSLEDTRYFYATMGKEYNLAGIDIDINYGGKNVSSRYGEPLQFRYTTKDRLIKELEEDPNLVQNLRGKRKEIYFREGLGVTEDAKRDILLRESKETLTNPDVGGMALNTGKFFLFSLEAYNRWDISNRAANRMLVRILTHINIHELGHVFYLDHHDVEGQPGNTMRTNFWGKSAYPDLNHSFSREQVSKVLEYFLP